MLKKTLTFFCLLFVFVSLINCQTKKSIEIVPANEESKDVPLLDYCQKLILTIQQNDLKILVTLFDDVVTIQDEEYSAVYIRKSKNFDNFVNRQGPLYATLFDTKLLNSIRTSNELDKASEAPFLEKDAISLSDALRNISKIRFSKSQEDGELHSLSIVLKDNPNYLSITLWLTHDSRKLTSIDCHLKY